MPNPTRNRGKLAPFVIETGVVVLSTGFINKIDRLLVRLMRPLFHRRPLRHPHDLPSLVKSITRSMRVLQILPPRSPQNPPHLFALRIQTKQISMHASPMTSFIPTRGDPPMHRTLYYCPTVPTQQHPDPPPVGITSKWSLDTGRAPVQREQRC